MKFTKILFAAALPAIAFLASCGGEDDTTKPKPTLTFKTGAGYTSGNATASVDSNLKIGIIGVTADKKLKSAKIELSTNGGANAKLWDTTISVGTFNYDYNFKVAGSVADNLKLTFTVTDDNGESASTSLTVEVLPPTVAIGLQQNQYVYNIIGAEKGAYDLATSAPKGVADPETVKDLKDMTTVSVGGFSKAWTSGNGTKFVRVDASDWDNSTSSNYLYNLWKNKASTATTSITNLALNDVILVKTGQPVDFNIYIIKVTEVKETTSDNLDYIKFSYKGDI